MSRRLAIRDLLLLTVGALTLTIAALVLREVYGEWQRLERIESLKRAMSLSDQLFNATEALSVERDIAATMLHAPDAATVNDLKPRLDESRKQVDDAIRVAMQLLKTYAFPELPGIKGKIETQLTGIQKLRLQIDQAVAIPGTPRDNALAKRWSDEVTGLIQQTQDLWTGFVKHFTDIDPIVTQHLRFKHFLGIITDYTGRERALISRLLVENADPAPDEIAQLLRGQGMIDLSWKVSFILADQSGLYPAIAPTYTDARSHYSTLHDMMRDIFYVPDARHGAAYPISADLWLELSTQATESLDALKKAALKETQRYTDGLEARARQSIAAHMLLLLFSLGLCLYSFRVILYRVIHPINAMVKALLDATEGKPVSFTPLPGNQDEIGKLAQVLHAFQQNVERIRHATAKMTASENRMRAVVDNALNGIITINEQGIVESFNPACEHLFGYTATEVIGQNIKMLMPEPYHSEHDGYLSRYLKTGEARIIGTAGREAAAKRKDGSVFPIELSVCAFHIEEGRHFSGIIQDITERKRAEAELISYTKALERSNKELDDFAYIASHDLKEPLRGIHNHSRFLLEDNEDKLDEESARKLNRLVYLSQRMERLVNDLLYFSRLGRQELAIQSSDINAVIDDIESTLDVFMAEHKARIIIPNTLPTITCDKVRVTEAFRNLITNAIKYNDKPEKTVEIGFLEAYASPQGATFRNVFYVKDNGKGIAPEFYEEIFRIFKRLQSGAATAEEGTGVGLTFVKKIIERHGGKIWLESKPGQGTTFYFTLEGREYDAAAA